MVFMSGGHTPSPFTVADKEEWEHPDWASIHDISHDHLDCARVVVVVDGEPSILGAARLSLILAAPDLLAACERLLTRAERDGWSAEDSTMVESRAAIAKALGK
jgi:hypothetical protein